MLKITGKRIRINRGDAIEIEMTYEINPPENGQEIFFQINDQDGNKILQKTLEVEDGKITLELSSAETDMAEGKYRWGLYMPIAEENGYAPLPSAEFIVEPSEAFPGTVTI